MRFELQAVCPETGARAGRIHTAHGIIETPVFMPVGTQATVKGLPQRMLERDLDVRILLANTYHLFLRPGPETIRKLGGLHTFMAWPRAILTDSGGYQVFSLSRLRTVTDRGVLFRSHIDGDEHLFTPESTVDAQLAFGSDILMALDECPAYPAPEKTAREAVDRTVGWARAAWTHYEQRRETEPSAGALFPIVQGSMDPRLRSDCAGALVALNAPGYAIGGLSVGEPRELSLRIAAHTAPLLPADKPRYVMGVGMPEELAEYAARGVDMMDCVLPSRNARNGCLFTSHGRVPIKQARYRDDPAPLDAACSCYTCRTFSRAYLRHLFQAGEMLFSTLATLHNLTYYLDTMRQIRQAILLGSFPAYLSRARSAPAV